MKWMVIGCGVRQRKLFSISKKKSTAVFEPKVPDVG